MAELTDTATPHAGRRLVFVISSLGPGGAERVASNMLNHWAAQGSRVTLITFAGQAQDHYPLAPEIERIELDIFEPSTSLVHAIKANFTRWRLLRRQITALQPDAVISFIDATNILVLAALYGTSIPVIVSERVDPTQYTIRRARRLARRLLYRTARAVVVQTEGIADWARGVTHRGRVKVIANPLGTLPEAVDIGQRQPLVLGAGRLTHQKGFDLLIQGFAQSRAPSLGWRLAIIGDGPDRDALQRLAANAGMTDQVSLPGIQQDPWQWMNRARIFVLSSRFEGFPNALMEAMAMGCAPVAANCPSGPAELIDHGVNGLLVAPQSIEAITQAINRLVEDADQIRSFSNRAQKVRQRFAINEIMARWDEVINEVTGK